MEIIGGGWIVGIVGGMSASWFVGKIGAQRMRWRMGAFVAWLLAFPCGIAAAVALTFAGSWLIDQSVGGPWNAGSWVLASLRAGIVSAFAGALGGAIRGRRS